MHFDRPIVISIWTQSHIASVSERLEAARTQAEQRDRELAEVQAQLGARASAMEELMARKSELVRDASSAQEAAQKWADEAAQARRTADGMEAEMRTAQLESELLKRRVQVRAQKAVRASLCHSSPLVLVLVLACPQPSPGPAGLP